MSLLQIGTHPLLLSIPHLLLWPGPFGRNPDIQVRACEQCVNINSEHESAEWIRQLGWTDPPCLRSRPRRGNRESSDKDHQGGTPHKGAKVQGYGVLSSPSLAGGDRRCRRRVTTVKVRFPIFIADVFVVDFFGSAFSTTFFCIITFFLIHFGSIIASRLFPQ